MRVLICGGRDWPETDEYSNTVESLLSGLYEMHHIGMGLIHMSSFTLIEGCARGADSVACRWGRGAPTHHEAGVVDGNWGVAPFMHLHFPVLAKHWESHGKAAGPIRNRQMLEEGKPDVVYAFCYKEMGRGTANMVKIAREAGIPVFITYGG